MDDKLRANRLCRLADIGGISRGTVRGVNPGAAFLRYVETVRLIVFVIALDRDPLRTRRSLAERIVRDYAYLRKTVEAYKDSFRNKRRLILLNRFSGIDENAVTEARAAFCRAYPGEQVIAVCADNSLAGEEE